MKVSIITTSYNRKKTIEYAIKSVLSQSYKDIEYIIIDGASKDGTMDVVNKYRSRITTVISEPDNGMYEAINKGISFATGDIVGILHSDDLFYGDDTIAKVVEAFNQSDADIVYGNGIYIANDSRGKVKRIYSVTEYKDRYLYFGWIPLHTTIYAKRDVFETYGLYDPNYSIASDYEISLRWFTNTKIKKHFLNDFLVKMRLGGKSTSASLQKKKSVEDYSIIKEYKLSGYFTLACKIARKIPQYLAPFFKKEFQV